MCRVPVGHAGGMAGQAVLIANLLKRKNAATFHGNRAIIVRQILISAEDPTIHFNVIGTI